MAQTSSGTFRWRYEQGKLLRRKTPAKGTAIYANAPNATPWRSWRRATAVPACPNEVTASGWGEQIDVGVVLFKSFQDRIYPYRHLYDYPFPSRPRVK
jgi:hypothetical protein